MEARKDRGNEKRIPATGNFMPSAVSFSVLGYQDEEEWVALALEMDLRGYGKSFEEALEELTELVAMQIGFAQFKRQPGLIWRPAEPVWFQLFADVRRQYLEALLQEQETPTSPYQIAGLQLPPAHLIASLKSSFMLAEG